MPVIAFVSSKGGVGKTTAALSTALGLAELGRRVTMVDSDPNLPLVRWASLPGRPELIDVIAAPGEADLPNDVRRARIGRGGVGPDWVILDTEGGARSALHTAMRLADLTLIPTGPSPLETNEALRVAAVARDAAQTLKRPVVYACVLTRLSARRPELIAPALAQLRGAGAAVAPTALFEGEAFHALFAQGGSLAGLDPDRTTGVELARHNVRLFVKDIEALCRAGMRAD